MASSTQTCSSKMKNESMPASTPAQERVCAAPPPHPNLYGNRKRLHPAHIRATRRQGCLLPPPVRPDESWLDLRLLHVTSLFQDQPSFRGKFRFRAALEQLFYARQGAAGGRDPSLNRFIRTCKIVPG